MTKSADTAATEGRLDYIPLEQIVESATNPRRTFGDLAELAASIKAKGVLQPILVRKFTGIDARNPIADYELVCGARRFRASKMAGAATIPAVVRENLDDKTAAEIQLIENCQRQDVSPIDEAEAYLTLKNKHGYTVAELALKVGKSEAHVYQRMKLAELPKDGLEAVAADELALVVALALARIPNAKLRTEATREVLQVREDRHYDHKEQREISVRRRMSSEEALALIRRKYNLRFDGCGFSLDDISLVAEAGACSKCPKRSVNQPMLFPDFGKKDDLCTDPVCFEAKRQAAWKRQKAELEEKGRVVLDGKAAESVVGDFGVRNRSTHAELKDVCWEDPKGRTYKQLLGKEAEQATIVARDTAGRVHEVVDTKVAERVLKDKGILKPEKHKVDPAEARRRKEERHKRTITLAAIAAVVEAAQTTKTAADFWRLLIWFFCRSGYSDAIRETVKRRGWAEKKKRPDDQLEKRAELLSEGELRALVLEVIVNRGAFFSYNPDIAEGVKRACEFYGVDLDRIELDVKAAEKEKRR